MVGAVGMLHSNDYGGSGVPADSSIALPEAVLVKCEVAFSSLFAFYVDIEVYSVFSL